MRIQHNIMAMNAYRNYSSNVSAMQKNLEKLSSGYKINRAGDDAAGLAISEKMRAQITGLETAQKNAKDGISLVQTAEGALTEVHDMLNRMVELATQSANGTYDSTTDRKQMQKEVDQLLEEINRIADSSNFNGIKLLDGSMDAEGTIHGSGTTNALKEFNLPGAGSLLGTNTVVHAEGSDATTGTEFSVDLHNITFDNRTEGNELTITIGDKALKLKVLTAGTDAKMDAATIVDKIMLGTTTDYEVTFNGGQLTAGNMKALFGGQNFSMTDNGTRLSFKQDDAPTASNEVVAGDMAVNITASVKPVATVTGTADKKIGVEQANISGDAADDTVVATGGKLDATNLDKDKILAAAKKAGLATGTVTIGHEGDKLTLKVGDEVISTSEEDVTWTDLNGATTAGTATATFKDADGNALGSVTITGSTTTGQDIAATDFDTSKATGLTFTAAPATQTKTLDASTLAADAAKTAIIKAAKAANVTTAGAITIVKNGTTNFQLKVGDTVIGMTDDVNAPAALVFKDADGNAIATVSKSTGATDPTANDYTVALNTGLTYTPPQAAETPDVFDYNKSTTNIKNVTVGADERLASTRVTVTKDMVKEGSSIKIGESNYTFKVDKNSTLSGTGVVDVSDLDASAATYLSDVLTRLTKVAENNTAYTVGHDDGGATFTVTEKVGQTVYAENGKSTLTSVDAIKKTLGYKDVNKAATPGKSLTLQIGDTADEFNKLTVNIKDMHAENLGLEGLKINEQGLAQGAIDKIKAAINTVSDVRGDLGATQNRLDHTMNNLSVMEENIQDAESSIRDVDVAKEMMAYTKNNILIQSAQAMLAQANQVPQGVLQLLQ